MFIATVKKCCLNQKSLYREGFLYLVGLLSVISLGMCIILLLTLITWGINIQNWGFDDPVTFGQAFQVSFMFVIVPTVSFVIATTLCWLIWGYFQKKNELLLYTNFIDSIKNATYKGTLPFAVTVFLLFFLWYFWASVLCLGFTLILSKKDSGTFESHIGITFMTVVFINIVSLAGVTAILMIISWVFGSYIEAQDQILQEIEMIEAGDVPTTEIDPEVVIVESEDAN